MDWGGDCHSIIYPHGHRNSHSDVHRLSLGHANCHAHGNRDADGDMDSNTGGHRDTHANGDGVDTVDGNADAVPYHHRRFTERHQSRQPVHIEFSLDGRRGGDRILPGGGYMLPYSRGIFLDGDGADSEDG